MPGPKPFPERGGFKVTVRSTYSLALILVAAGLAFGPIANAQFREDFPSDDKPPISRPPIITTPPPLPVVTPPPPPPPRVVTPPHVPPVTFVPPLTVPTDATHPNLLLPQLYQDYYDKGALEGIKLLSENLFPEDDELAGESNWIKVIGAENSSFKRPSPYTAVLEEGTILVSVRRPSHLALIKTPLGEISLNSDGDLAITFENGLLRIQNVSGRGTVAKIKFKDDICDDLDGKVISIAPGFELLGADHKISRAELRPADGIARRGSKVLANGNLAINEFSVESFLNSSVLIAGMVNNTASDKQERRILADMSKMAAVLNYFNGTHGYTTESTGLASKNSNTQ
jgi:hypothetical protein